MSLTHECPHCRVALEAAPLEEKCPQCGSSLTAPVAVPVAAIPPTPVFAQVPPPPPISAAALPTALPYGALEQAAVYLGMARTLRGIGIGQIIWGVLIITISIIMANMPGVSSTPTSALLIGIIGGLFGLFFIGQGIWLIVAPSAVGLLVAAITMFVLAAVFLGRILLMLVLIFYGVALIKRYKKYGPLMEAKPPPDMLTQAGELLNRLQKAARKHAPELVEFSASDMLTRRLYRGLLLDNLAVVITLEKRLFGRGIGDIYFLSPAEFTIEVSKKELIGKWLKGTISVREQQAKGTIPPECFERYQAWKLPAMPHI